MTDAQKGSLARGLSTISQHLGVIMGILMIGSLLALMTVSAYRGYRSDPREFFQGTAGLIVVGLLLSMCIFFGNKVGRFIDKYKDITT